MPNAKRTEKSQDIHVEGEIGNIKADILKNIEEGNLIVVTVGDDTNKPTKEDLARVSEHMVKVFENIKGVKVLVLPHTLKVEKLSLPQLRTVLNDVIVGPNENAKDYNPIIDLDIS